MQRIAFLALVAGLIGCSGGSSGGSAGVGAAAVASTTGGTPTGSAAPMSSGTLSLLTYNVAGLPHSLSGSAPFYNTPQISPLLNNYDLVVVQEDFTYHAELARDALHPFQSPPLTQFSTLTGDGLNRFSRTAFVDFTRNVWSVCHGFVNASNDCLSSKGFSVARHELWPGVQVDVYNLHMDAGGSADDHGARTAQVNQLLQFMQAYSGTRAVIVAGDTNLKDTRADDMVLLDHLLNTANLTDSARSLQQVESIDRVLFRSSADVALSATSWRFADEFVDANGQDLSDHLAVHVDVHWQRLR